MSAVAMPYDHSLSMGPRSTFWPGELESRSYDAVTSNLYDTPGSLDSSSSTSSILSGDLSSIGSAPSDPSLTPPSIARSISSSPPRTSFTPEQREYKKQQNRARRDSRLATRMSRTASNASLYMDSPPQMPLSDNGLGMPVYSTSPTPLSLLTEPATSMPSQSYMSSSYSPPMHDHASSGVFPSYHHQLSSSYSMPMEYSNSYPSPADYTRPSSLPQDSGMMYQVPSVLNSSPSSGHGHSHSHSHSHSHEGGHVRVVQSRPKPRCWEHGCNGRQFSTFSNLLRHQREKSGQASKASCPNCGAEFTRTTARNGHMLHDKCKQRRTGSTSSQ